MSNTVDRTDQGLQRVIPGAERVPDRVLAERRGAAPLRPRAPQKPLEGGLFDVAGRGQGELFK